MSSMNGGPPLVKTVRKSPAPIRSDTGSRHSVPVARRKSRRPRPRKPGSGARSRKPGPVPPATGYGNRRPLTRATPS